MGRVKDIKKVLCETMYDFVKEHINDISETYDTLGFKDEEDMLQQIKSSWDIAYWAMTELLGWGMRKNNKYCDYCCSNFIAEDREEYTIYKIKGRYFKPIITFKGTYYDVIDIKELVRKKKIIEIFDWVEK